MVTYGIRLYELLMQWKTSGKREVEIDWLKKQFQIEEGYERMFDLKKYVIEPAVKDINTHSNYQVAWTQRKTGRRVTHLTFEFSEKQPVKPKKAKSKATPEKVEKTEPKMDNVEYFAEMRKKYGELADAGIPDEIKTALKAQGKW